MIILEGPDAAGKTTLANKLSSFLHMKVKHSGGPCILSELEKRMSPIMQSNKNVIWDRVPCISESVYGPIIRHTDIFEGTIWLQKLLNLKPLIIYCRAPTEFMLKTHEFKAHESEAHIKGVMENGRKLIEAYDNKMRTIPHLGYDWTQMTYNHTALFMAYCKLSHGRKK